ncbi:hypothetical protein CGCFRS4_v016021 [Colletotrichum fructicola]|nr:hypothetical protein CGCFRS4_v016021 [Colletotrichum fructicola]
MSRPSDLIVDDGFKGQHTARSTRSLSSFDFDETEATDSDDNLGQQILANDRDFPSPGLHSTDHNELQGAHMPYVVEWKLTANNRTITKDSEHNITIAPQAFWERQLKEQVQEVLRRKLPPHKTFRPVDSDVVVSVTERSQRDLVKRFDELNIDWTMVESQLQEWSHLTRAGKKLRIDISFNFVVSRQETTSVGRTKRRRRSVTDQMLSDRALQINAEESSTSLAPVWPSVYNLMRCTGPPCRAGPYCWRDRATQKHYQLKTHHLRSLVKYAKREGMLKTHDDMPDFLRDQLYAEEESYRRRRRRLDSTGSQHHVDVDNPVGLAVLEPAALPPATTPAVNPLGYHRDILDIPGLRDDAMELYTEWQCSKIRDEGLKLDFRRACDVALEDGLDLELIHQGEDAAFFVERGVRRGIALRFIQDIKKWAQQQASESSC